ncbi:hypothetical protein [Catenovulum agarivorans]|nr:hypothetical protein [Catenovulum agarivorans]
MSFVLLVCAFSNTVTFANNNTIVFSCSLNPESEFSRALNSIYTQAFIALGYSFEMRYFKSATRALEEAQKGNTDGECARVGGFPERFDYNNLYKLNAVVRTSDFAAWTYNPTITFSDVESLKQSNYKVGFQNGSLIAQEFAELHQLSNLHIAANFRSTLKMLEAERIHVFISGSDMVLEQAHQIVAKPIHKITRFYQFNSYPYLHKKHAQLIPRLELHLNELLPEGGITTAAF